jgi:NurA-like 5'-3' nuclease
MCNSILKGILSKRDRELLEMDTYYKREYSNDYRDAWFYGDEKVEEIHSEWDSLSDGFLLEDYSDK